MAGQYLSDLIGEEYKSWKPGQTVLIATGTGSGKTWFVLNCLLPYAKKQGKHIVYYCNRKFLNMQVQASAQKKIYDALGEDKEGLASYLHIRTYQYTENQKDFPNVIETKDDGSKRRVYASEVLYYVMDESWYFVQDASFSKSTKYWYDKRPPLKLKNSVVVFLAATPEPLYLYQSSYQWEFDELCKRYIARDSIEKNLRYRRWACYLNQNPDVEQSVMKEYLGDPYGELFEQIKKIYNRKAIWADYVYEDERSLSERYAYANTYYFDAMDSLARLIEKSVKAQRRESAEEASIEGAWLVFVRTIEDAKSLQLALKALDCSSVIIFSQFTKRYDGRITNRKNTKRSIFNTLVNQEYLGTRVLISSSVLDCGTTLHAPNVSNLVLCQPNKTSFLQMLGRIRVQEGQKINLYIQLFTPKQVESFARKYEGDFRFLAYFWWINELSHKSRFMKWPEPNMFTDSRNDYMYFLPEETREWVIRELEKDERRKRFLIEKDQKRRRHYDLQSVTNLSVNELAVIHYLSQVYFYQVELPKYEGDPYYFLKTQLSWIGKTYDPTAWIDYQASREGICDYLAQVSQQEPMYEIEREAFREKCFELLRDMRDPPDSLVEEKRRHSVGSRKYPGKKKLNDIFVDAGIPYQIRSPQNKKMLIDKETGEKVIDPKTGKPKVNNKSPWRVVATDVDVLRSDLEQARAEKRRKRESSKAELQQQEPQENHSNSNAADQVQESTLKQSMRIIVRKGDEVIFQSK